MIFRSFSSLAKSTSSKPRAVFVSALFREMSSSPDKKRKGSDVSSPAAKSVKTEVKIQLNPYITFNGNASEAIDFYVEKLGGTIESKMTYGSGPTNVDEASKDKIMHSTMHFGSNTIMISDAVGRDKMASGDNISMSLNFEDVTEMEKVFNGLGAGGTVTMPLAKQFWGATFGMLKDKFGINWMFNCDEKGKDEAKEEAKSTPKKGKK